MRETVLSSNSLTKVYLVAVLFAITGGMLLVVQNQSLFFLVGSLILFSMLVYLLNNPIPGIILFLSTKCIFDMFWFIKLPFAEFVDLNVQRLIGIVFPLVILGIFVLKERNFFKTFNTTLGKLICIYIAFNFLMIFFSWTTSGAMVLFSKMITSYILFFVFGVAVFVEKDLRKLIHYFLICLWIPLTIAYLGNLGWLSLDSFIQNTQYQNAQRIFSSTGELIGTRLVGLYSHPFNVVSYLIVAFPLTLLMLFTEKNPLRRFFYQINFIFLSLAMWRCFYRTGWIILALQLFLWLKMRKRRKTMLAVILICVCVVLMNLSFFTSFYESFLVLFSPSSENVLSAFSGRFVIWSFHLTKFAASSRLEQFFGHGLGSDHAIYYEMSDVLEPDRGAAHSDFIRHLSDTGVIGLGIYVLILVLLGKELLSSIKQENDRFWRAFGQTVLLIFTGFLLASIIGDPSLNPSMSWYLWGFAGIVIGRKFLNNKWKQERGRAL